MSAPFRVRPMIDADTQAVGEVLRTAFGQVYAERGFPTPFPNIDGAVWLGSAYLALDREGAFVADQGGLVIGCGFVHLRGDAASIGPVAAMPAAPHGVGRAIMNQLLAIAQGRSTRLFQDSFNPESFALYTKLGFEAFEPVAYVIADTLGGGARHAECATMLDRDFDEVAALDLALTGSRRTADLREIFLFGTGLVLRRAGRLCGYLLARRGSTRLVVAPAAAESADDLRALLGELAHRHAGQPAAARVPAGARLGGAGLALRTALEHGFRIEHLGHLMVRGRYNEGRSGAQLLAIFPEAL